jgi:hypothetical protein
LETGALGNVEGKMGKASLERELEELRKQVELLSDRQVSTDVAEEPSDDGGLPDDTDNLSLLKAKLEDFMGMLQKDMREIPATTAVGIFALGVLMGRLLPR